MPNCNNLSQLFDWCEDNLSNFERVIRDESEHYYLNGVRVGGWAGDTQQFFIQNEGAIREAIQEAGGDITF